MDFRRNLSTPVAVNTISAVAGQARRGLGSEQCQVAPGSGRGSEGGGEREGGKEREREQRLGEKRVIGRTRTVILARYETRVSNSPPITVSHSCFVAQFPHSHICFGH